MEQIGKREIKEMNEELSSYGVELSKKNNVAVEDDKVYVDKELSFFRDEGKLYPSLRYVYKNPEVQESMKKISVDMGAVRFVAKGADIMNPGIKSFGDGIRSGDVVLVIDENNKKPIAIGQSRVDSEDFNPSEKGKSIRNVHHVGDSIWDEES